MQVWINTDDMATAASIGELLQKAVDDHSQKQFKGFLIFINAPAADIEKLASDKKLERIGLARLTGGTSDSAIASYQINTGSNIKNTVFVYKNRKVAEKFVNLSADKDGLAKLQAAIDKVAQ